MERGEVQTLKVVQTKNFEWLPFGTGTNQAELKSTLAICSVDAIRLFDVATGSCVSVIHTFAGAFAFSPDGKRVASLTKTEIDQELLIWSIEVRLLRSL